MDGLLMIRIVVVGVLLACLSGALIGFGTLRIRREAYFTWVGPAYYKLHAAASAVVCITAETREQRIEAAIRYGCR